MKIGRSYVDAAFFDRFVIPGMPGVQPSRPSENLWHEALGPGGIMSTTKSDAGNLAAVHEATSPRVSIPLEAPTTMMSRPAIFRF